MDKNKYKLASRLVRFEISSILNQKRINVREELSFYSLTLIPYPALRAIILYKINGLGISTRTNKYLDLQNIRRGHKQKIAHRFVPKVKVHPMLP